MAQRKYDEQLKKDIIDAVLIGNKSAAQVAREHDVPDSAVYTWIRNYKEKNNMARLALKNEPPEQEIARLKAELYKATQERDTLKKATVESSGQCNTFV